MVFRFVTAALILLATSASGQTDLPAGDPEKGRKIFHKKCVVCHSLEPEVHKVGASLYDLFGQVGGTSEGYAYSSSMEAIRPLWGAYAMEYWTQDPRSLVPGTKMSFAGIKEASERADLIAYLRKATSPPPTMPENEFWASNSFSYISDVQPIFKNYCSGCHGHNNALSAKSVRGVLLTDYNELMLGGLNGKFIKPGRSEDSRIFDFVNGEEHFSTVSDLEIDVLKRWIDGGAERDNSNYNEEKNELVISNLTLAGGGYVYCKPDVAETFLNLVISDSDGVSFIDWDLVPVGEHATWQIPDDDRYWEKVQRLSIFPSPANSEDTPLATKFVFSRERIPDSLVDEYFKRLDFQENPVKPEVSGIGTLSFWLANHSDVVVDVIEIGEEGRKIVEKIDLPDVTKGENRLHIDFGEFVEDRWGPSQYSLALKIRPRNSSLRSSAMAIRVELDWQ